MFNGGINRITISSDLLATSQYINGHKTATIGELQIGPSTSSQINPMEIHDSFHWKNEYFFFTMAIYEQQPPKTPQSDSSHDDSSPPPPPPPLTSGYQNTCMTHYQMQSHHFISTMDYYQNASTWFPFIHQCSLVVRISFSCQVITDLEKGLARCAWI